MDQHDLSSKLVTFTKEKFGDRSSMYSDALYLQSKAKYAIGERETSLELIRNAIKIESNKPTTGTKSDLPLAMMFLMKATLYTNGKLISDKREALKCYKKAIKIAENVNAAAVNI